MAGLSMTRILLGVLGVLLVLAAKGIWSGRMLIGFDARQTESGEVFYGWRFGTADTFSGSSAAKYRRAPRVRALLTLAVGIALVGGLLSSRVYRADLHMLAIAWVVLAVALLATLALLCLFRGVIGLYYGARPALRVVWIGPFWMWFGNRVTRAQAIHALREARLVPSKADDRTEAERFLDQSGPTDPMEELGEEALGAVLPQRLIAGYLLAVGVLLLASAISRSGGAVTGLVDGASTLMWIAAVVALVGIVLSGEAAEGAGIAIRCATRGG